ncbi:hypothetical protein EV644_111145 [Kribbella orskensis]|uniref:Uncharacterized protein n=1 Tax=Kribbella orskensis TaxID=2512216 RepID=A0ABY2BI94_9ACTN|nr:MULTISPECIES: hypothetical protein [Kribbella]TCN37591.1 hypothetical protein EV642_111120 [Kribbella sp. VKM Ac-2500]TCO18907.1 hypothetical protein EV644_111145 [Kribbella orskensis]
MNDGKVDLAVFNRAFARACDRVRGDDVADIEAEQAALQALVPANASEHDRGWTGRLIASLAEPPAPPRQWSEYYHQAGAVHAAASRAEGTVEEKIAALEQARRKIWEISEQAPADEEIHIKAMTRVLEHVERELRDPTFLMEEHPGQRS